jgi:hypothetical protein
LHEFDGLWMGVRLPTGTFPSSSLLSVQIAEKNGRTIWTEDLGEENRRALWEPACLGLARAVIGWEGSHDLG